MSYTSLKLTKQQVNEALCEQLGDEMIELENHFILRLPQDVANNVKQWISEGEEAFKDKLQININQDMRHAQVKVGNEIFNGVLMDLPCIVETLKTVDKKNFYKVADCPQILICKREGEEDIEEIFKKSKNKSQRVKKDDKNNDNEDPNKKKDKQYQYPHGLTPPLKNVRKRRFRKTLRKKYLDAPELEKELKRLLRTDLEAVSVRWEVVTPEQEAEQKQKTHKINDSGAGQQGSVRIMTEPSSRMSDSKEPLTNLMTIKEDDIFGEALSSTSSSSAPSVALSAAGADDDEMFDEFLTRDGVEDSTTARVIEIRRKSDDTKVDEEEKIFN
uniref:TAFII55 protein conserved region domain-containing protein n=1 Tax=Romanomermis culicivorax TaxID=13658 RepID=A0A915I797_ROMCU